MNIYLDLEETVIDDWYSVCFLEHKILIIKDIIQNLTEKYNDYNINLILFSAAVCNEDDVRIFEDNIKNDLENKLGIPFNSYYTFSNKNIFKLAKQNGIKKLPDDTIHDIFMFNIKEEVFNLLCKENNGINVLFDDTVTTKIITHSKTEEMFDDVHTRIDICVNMQCLVITLIKYKKTEFIEAVESANFVDKTYINKMWKEFNEGRLTFLFKNKEGIMFRFFYDNMVNINN